MRIENIKFKAKRLDNGEWCEGYFYEENGNTYIIENRQKESVLNRNVTYEVDPSTVCQFTGLKDCKGREVWEGDILQDVDDDNIKYVVIFAEGTFLAQKEGLYTGIPLHECVGSLGNDVITYAKVVGNKFDKEQRMKKETFDFSEALRRMKEGKKVRRIIWEECGAYIHIVSKTIIAVCDENFFPCVFKDSEDILATDWEEV